MRGGDLYKLSRPSSCAELWLLLPRSCMAMLGLMCAVTIYKQPGSFWEYKMWDVIAPAT